MMTATATGFRVTMSPRPVRIEKPTSKDVQAVANFMQGKEPKSLRKQRRVFGLLLGLLAVTPAHPVWAALPKETIEAMKKEAVIPPEVDMVLLKIQLLCLGLCVSVAVIMAMIAGLLRIIGLREEARRRYADACMGMIQVLTAPAVLGILAMIVRGLLKLFPGSLM